MVLDGDKHEVTSVAKGQQGNLLATGFVDYCVMLLCHFMHSSKLFAILLLLIGQCFLLSQLFSVNDTLQ